MYANLGEKVKTPKQRRFFDISMRPLLLLTARHDPEAVA
jgi:hypothetical protein